MYLTPSSRDLTLMPNSTRTSTPTSRLKSLCDPFPTLPAFQATQETTWTGTRLRAQPSRSILSSAPLTPILSTDIARLWPCAAWHPISPLPLPPTQFQTATQSRNQTGTMIMTVSLLLGGNLFLPGNITIYCYDIYRIKISHNIKEQQHPNIYRYQIIFTNSLYTVLMDFQHIAVLYVGHYYILFMKVYTKTKLFSPLAKVVDLDPCLTKKPVEDSACHPYNTRGSMSEVQSLSSFQSESCDDNGKLPLSMLNLKKI